MVEVSTSPKAPAPEEKPKQEKGFVSAGQSGHKWGSYITVDWGLNYVTGLLFAMWANFHPWGQKWSAGVKYIATGISKNVFRFKDGADLDSSVKNVSMIANVIAGGMFTIPPLMVLESKKIRRGISKKIDEWYYGKEAVANDPKFEESYDAIDNAPKQGWVTGLASRLTALAPCIAVVYFKSLKEWSKPYFDFVERNSMRIYDGIGLNKNRLFKKLSESEKDTRWKTLHENSAVDFGLEPWYAVLHMITYRAFAGIVHAFQGKPPEPVTTPATAKTTAAPETTPQTVSAKPSPSTKVSADAQSHRMVADVSQPHLAHA